ncbi:isochorismate synthase [Allofranklinella schreckenbergeri]|uniref:isochorismate synthase n=1 Tax=Allofranklinella schreckenbergeri TaxID=1076744 RepID=A0A3M6Q909_9BURK|nr:isochorismate synthase [Allofranklinella schreckenbergeri]RMW99130.1 isochorismate synthase [Allofranklinella schreckenbergeri]
MPAALSADPSTAPGAPFAAASATEASATSATATLAAGEVFFTTPMQQQWRSHAHAQDIHCLAPATPHTVQTLFAQARTRGIGQAQLFAAIPFDVRQPASFSIPARLVQTSGPLPQQAVQTPDPALHTTPLPSPERYAELVRQALALLERGELHKIVLARALDVQAGGPLSPGAIVQRLAARNPHAFLFHIPLCNAAGAPHGSMLGASPELLVRRSGRQLTLHPLAGSIPRHADAAEDERRRQGLAASEKDLREHRYVTQDIARHLAPLCCEVDVPERPSVIGTDALWHLGTTITATLRDGATTALDVALALHPTPALCGSPTAQALAHIQALEPFARDYFAGLVGWQRENGDGEWAITIRCAQFDGQRRLRLYAGAGIVSGSDPEREVQETAAKLSTFLQSLQPQAIPSQS